MPNWNYNSVDVHAPKDAVMAWLIPHYDTGDNATTIHHYLFNMHRLFPETFPADDPAGDKNWDYDWFVDNTGSKWAPEVYVSESEHADVTYLNYDTARSPNNLMLWRLHEKTGWLIRNDYEEEGMQFAGTFTCDEHGVTDEEHEYQTTCEICEEKKPEEQYDEELDGLICNDCRKKRGSAQ